MIRLTHQHLSKLVPTTCRGFGTKVKSLRDRLVEILPEKQEALMKLNREHGDKIVGTCNVSQCIGGMRSVKCMLWETSLLDAQEGIRFRGYSIPELQKLLPTYEGGEIGTHEPIPESILWLLLTGEIPTEEEVRSLTAELHARSELPPHIEPMIRNFPEGMHPMTQLSSAILGLQTESKFVQAYQSGMNKKLFWDPVLEDCLDLIARLPRIAALIYRSSFHDGKIADYDSDLDYSANFNRMLGFPAHGNGSATSGIGFDECMRMYLSIHTDHEGGNASAHATHLVGSTLSDPYLSLSGGMNALAGPLHGLANQEVLKWTIAFQRKILDAGKEINHDSVRDAAWDTLNSGQVIPGFGHAVLRKTDPRYTVQREFALKYFPDDPLFQVVKTMYEVIPGVLTEHGRTKNPFPNVDAHSGCLLQYYGLLEEDFYTVLFGVSRAMGVLSQLFWDRALLLPLERPKSVTSEWIQQQFADEDKFSGSFSHKDGQFDQTSVNVP